MNKVFLIFVLFTCAGVRHAYAQPTTFLQKLEGTWYASGRSFGMPSDVDMVWSKALNGKFTQIQYKITMHGKDGKDQIFEGTGYYKATGPNEYRATWFDSGGDMHPIVATDDGIALTSIWGTPETKMGKSVYKIVSETAVEVTDFIQSKDRLWKEFGKNTLNRK